MGNPPAVSKRHDLEDDWVSRPSSPISDEMNMLLLTTKKMVDAVEPLEPWNNILGLSGPNEMSSNIKFPKTLVSTMSNWFNQ